MKRVVDGTQTTVSRGDANAWRGAYLNQVLALSLSDERLELGRGECIHEARFRDDEEEDLGAGQNGELVGLEEEILTLATVKRMPLERGQRDWTDGHSGPMATDMRRGKRGVRDGARVREWVREKEGGKEL